MKTEISSIEFGFLLKELNTLVGQRIDQIYSLEKKSILIQFRMIDGKLLLRISPDFFFITKTKKDSIDINTSFVTILRKYLNGKKIISIEQIGSERIIQIRAANFVLYIYFFGGKDKILCDKENTILASTNVKKFKKGEKLSFSDQNKFKISLDEFKKMIEEIDKNISKTLAIKLGVGGLYAEEICERAEINKLKEKITEKETEKLYNSFLSILNEKTNPKVIYEENIPKDAIPFEIKKYKNSKNEVVETFNEALRTVIEFHDLKIKKKQNLELYEKEKQKLLTIKQIQEENFKKIELESQELQKIGELIYDDYSNFKTIIDETNELRKKHSLKEIKEILKQKYKIVKDLNEKDKKILIDC